MPITRRNLRAFLDRPWDELRITKDRHTARVATERGAKATLRMAEELHAHLVQIGAVPTEAERAADLASAVRLRRLLDRAYRRSKRLR